MNKTITLLIIGVVFLALLLMVFNSFKVEERQGVSVPLKEKTRPQADAPSARVEERFAAAPVLAPSAPETPGSAALAPPVPNAASGRAASAEGVTVKTVPAQIDAGQTAPADSPPQAAAPSRAFPPKVPAIPDPGTGQTGGGGKNITTAVVYATQEGATLRLGGDKPLVYKSMLLRNPDRLVLDFDGQWNMTVPGVPQNKLIKSVRVGRQADSTRVVIDLHREPASYRLIKTSPQGLDVRLR